MIRLEVFRLGDDTQTALPQTSAGIRSFLFCSRLNLNAVLSMLCTEFGRHKNVREYTIWPMIKRDAHRELKAADTHLWRS